MKAQVALFRVVIVVIAILIGLGKLGRNWTGYNWRLIKNVKC